MKDFIITNRAQTDIENAFLWYFKIRPDLGEGLLGKINDAFRAIAERPQYGRLTKKFIGVLF